MNFLYKADIRILIARFPVLLLHIVKELEQCAAVLDRADVGAVDVQSGRLLNSKAVRVVLTFADRLNHPVRERIRIGKLYARHAKKPVHPRIQRGWLLLTHSLHLIDRTNQVRLHLRVLCLLSLRCKILLCWVGYKHIVQTHACLHIIFGLGKNGFAADITEIDPVIFHTQSQRAAGKILDGQHTYHAGRDGRRIIEQRFKNSPQPAEGKAGNSKINRRCLRGGSIAPRIAQSLEIIAVMGAQLGKRRNQLIPAFAHVAPETKGFFRPPRRCRLAPGTHAVNQTAALAARGTQ